MNELRLNIENEGLAQDLLILLDGVRETNQRFTANIIRLIFDYYFQGYQFNHFNLDGRNNKIRLPDNFIDSVIDYIIRKIFEHSRRNGEERVDDALLKIEIRNKISKFQ